MKTCVNCNHWVKSTLKRIHDDASGLNISPQSESCGVCSDVVHSSTINSVEDNTKSAVIKIVGKLYIPDSNFIKFVTGNEYSCNNWIEKSDLNPDLEAPVA